MSSTKILDDNEKIIEIVWDSKATPEEIDSITKEIQTYAQELGGYFDVIVDMRTVKVFAPESQAKLVEHQKSLKEFGMKRAAVVVTGTIAKMQLNRTARNSVHTTETQWDNYEEALVFLKKS
ncbi:hypothetical protein SAMN03159341_101617 [Paenibacillus sp. 1_12]|uniref:hypothetical protein n=1 Tax=Paenibacillus sp. 1_12 TaxID=1566278 RepID=UPI0008E186E8|nr:hypothetical protein [Paenibacillus sp. 1_12]SFK79762.1 hypothetical protein SAMN03159341_101617 [Paenibacillus sp. 1_12]